MSWLGASYDTSIDNHSIRHYLRSFDPNHERSLLGFRRAPSPLYFSLCLAGFILKVLSPSAFELFYVQLILIQALSFSPGVETIWNGKSLKEIITEVRIYIKKLTHL